MNARAIDFKPAVLEKISLLIGLAGGTGSGKTYSAMKMATGLAGRQPFAVIDTEAGRALHYAPRRGSQPDFTRSFLFQHEELHPPFRPDAYTQKILELDARGFPVIVVDSCSHEWAGDGGILEWHEEELQRMAGDDWKKREACKMAAWIKPKMAHKKMVSRLLQIRAHLILCFRAEAKVEMVRDEKDGKMKIVEKKTRTGLDGWVPICEKNLPFELTASFLLTEDAPGFPKPIKLEEQHRPFFPLNQPISEKAGQLFGEWARGGAPESEYEKLLDDYARCQTDADLKAAEARREALWKQQLPAGQKPKLKEASDAARKRLDEQKAREAITVGHDDVEDPAAWIECLKACGTLKDLEACWLRCADQFGALVPTEVGDTYEAKKESLSEREALGDL